MSLSSSLAAYYSFDNTLESSTGNGLALTPVNGGIYYSDNWYDSVGPKLGTGLAGLKNPNGDWSELSTGNTAVFPSLNLGNKFTISYWVKWIGDGGFKNLNPTYPFGPPILRHEILSLGAGFEVGPSFQLPPNTTNWTIPYHGWFGYDNNFIGTTQVSTTNWDHVVYTYDGDGSSSTVKMYVNGVLQLTINEAYDYEYNPDAILRRFYNGQVRNGSYSYSEIDELGFWRRAISSQEVADLYNGGAGITYSQIMATAPDAPTSVSASAGDGQAVVSFTAPANNGGSSITGYTVTSSPGGITATGNSSPILVTGLSNGTAYTFTVKATNAVGDSSESSASNSVTPVAATGLLVGLTGLWQLNGDLTDSVSGYNGVAAGNTPSYTSGLSNLGQALNNNATRVALPNVAALRPTGSFTLSAWIKPSAVGNYQEIVESYNQSSGVKGFEFRLNNNRQLELVLGNGTYYPLASSTQLSADTVYHVMAVFDDVGQTVKLFINNTEAFSSPTYGWHIGFNESINQINIGVNEPYGDGSYMYDFQGWIQQVGIWNVALTSQQRADLYNGGNGLAFSSFASQGQGGGGQGGGGGGGPVTGSFMPMRILTDLVAPKKVKFEEGLDVFSQKITSVSAGAVSSDAINFGQLGELSSSVVSYVGAGQTNAQNSLNSVSSSLKAYVDAQDSAQDSAMSSMSSSIKSYIDAADMAQDQATADLSSSLKGYVDAADSAFQSNLDQVSGAIKSYVDAADFAQDQALSSLSGAIAGELASEYLRATMAETDLSGALSAEITRATGAEQQLTSDLASEVTRAGLAETAIQSNIDAEVARAEGVESELSGGIVAEAARAAGVEFELSGALDAEVLRATGAETTIQGNIDTQAGRLDAILSGSTVDLDSFKEIVDLINSVSASESGSFANYVLTNDAAVSSLSGALSASINSETVRATAAEGVLTTDLATEISDRQAADAATKTAYDSLRYVETGSLVNGSVVITLVDFSVMEMANLALDAMVDYDNTGYTNSLVAVKMFSEGGSLKVQIDAPAYEIAKYRLIVVNKKKGGLA